VTLAIVPGTTVVRAEGATLGRVLDAAYPALHQGLSRRAFTTADTALRRTAWGLRNCAIGDVCSGPATSRETSIS
jgi:hypothetical protein